MPIAYGRALEKDEIMLLGGLVVMDTPEWRKEQARIDNLYKQEIKLKKQREEYKKRSLREYWLRYPNESLLRQARTHIDDEPELDDMFDGVPIIKRQY